SDRPLAARSQRIEMVVLDTDHISLLERAEGGPGARLRSRLEQQPDQDSRVTIISFEEQSRGWLTRMARVRTVRAGVEGDRKLKRHLDNYRKAIVLEFDEGAAIAFQRLKSQRIRIGTSDLRIAAIVIANDATLLSRNMVDFRKVPGLRVEDWTA